MPRLGLLRFEEKYFRRIWGGAKLRSIYKKNTPADQVIGEAWLVSDHPAHQSVVADGPHAGRTLHELMEAFGADLLGSDAAPTIHGRFPLLLKLLDTAQVLSVQVHPDDDAAARLEENDIGKTECWHIIAADAGSTIYCGLDDGVDAAAFHEAMKSGTVDKVLKRFEAEVDATVFVSAGTVHTIGGGLLVAEIQQNSDVTYRIFDWNRVDASGRGRELHIERALQVTAFERSHGGATKPLGYLDHGAKRTVLAACRHFASELVEVEGGLDIALDGSSFHILLNKSGGLEVESEGETLSLVPGEAALAPAGLDGYALHGAGRVLLYYVPEVERDIVEPLLAAGHTRDAIAALIGD